MTWNIEGFRRNSLNLTHYVNKYLPDFIFLSEPQIFGCDVENAMSFLRGDYEYSLNSLDKYEQDLPLLSSKAYGGTMVLWKRHLDPYVKVYPNLSTSSFLPIIFQPPDHTTTIHICIYLPTSGLEDDFLLSLSELSSTLNQLHLQYPDACFFLRGDFNVSNKNLQRNKLLETFKYEENLDEINVSHPTYHHFVGSGTSDSNLDKILVTSNMVDKEILSKVLCKFDEPFIDSHHDIILSSFDLTKIVSTSKHSVKALAPVIPNSRHRISWSEEGVQAYQSIVVPKIETIQNLWMRPLSRSNLSLLLDATNEVLTSSALTTNKSSSLASKTLPRSQFIPHHIRQSSKQLLMLWNELKYYRRCFPITSDEVIQKTLLYRNMKVLHRQLLRRHKAELSIERDSSLLVDPAKTFSRIRQAKKSNSNKIYKLNVGQDTYYGDFVKDGFFQSVASLKKRDLVKLYSSPKFCEFADDYRHIIEICSRKTPLKPVTEEEALSLLQRMKANVPDISSVTPNHFLLAGPAGWRLFTFLLNALIEDISHTSIQEINVTYACLIYKGHGKDKTSSNAYRTISTCPVTAKALDMHIRDLKLKEWNLDQSNIQFQGEGSSHELAALLLTECILFSTVTLDSPVYVLYLDAQAAFDVVQPEILIQKLFHVQE